jgi:stage V sporulation protein R
MTSWTFEELEKWDKKICHLAKTYGLDWHPIDYEMCDYFDMIGNMAYVGLPTHYHHWSFGKSFEQTHFRYNAGMEGLPYEMIINSNPSISYLMRENDMAMHVLTMAHCVGHSDFFKNNINFSHTDPENVISKFRTAALRIRRYVEDPGIGVMDVERILDAAHSIKYQCRRFPHASKYTHQELREKYIKLINSNENDKFRDFDIDKLPLEPDYDILTFIKENGRHLNEWEQDIINIVVNETNYFIPQARTKIMNEGWASFWHYRLLSEVGIPQEYHLSFLKSHNQVIRPHIGRINPYHLGFNLFKKIEKEKGLEECFFAREVHHDESFLREYLDEEICREINLFSYSLKRDTYTIDEVADHDGWKPIREDLIKNVGLNSIPKVYVEEVIKPDNTLILQHEFDGRELNLEYAEQVCKNITELWGDPVKFFTIIEDDPWEI